MGEIDIRGSGCRGFCYLRSIYNFPVKIRLLVASFCIVGSGSAATQLVGHFYLQKATFARGEPVFLYFSLMNKGPDTAVVVTGDSDQPLCSGISITVSSNPSASFSCPSSSRDNACVYNGPIRTQKLPAGQTYIARFLLNFHHDISATGDYWIDAKYNSVSDATEEGHARLEFLIDAESITSSDGSRGWSNFSRLNWSNAGKQQEPWLASRRSLLRRPCLALRTVLSFGSMLHWRSTG
jgi:hypothetical protein